VVTEASAAEAIFAAELAAEDDFLELLISDSKKGFVGLSMAFILQL